MGKTLDELLDELPAAMRARIDARAERLSVEYRTLRDVARKAKQGGSSLSELRDHVEANGGTLSLVVAFPGREPVNLDDLDDPEDSDRMAELRGRIETVGTVRKKIMGAGKLHW